MSQFISYPDNNKNNVTVRREGEWMNLVEDWLDFVEFVELDDRMDVYLNSMDFYMFVCKADGTGIGTHYELI